MVIDIAIFMPTRSRPGNAKFAYDAAMGDIRVKVFPVLDGEDPAWHGYRLAFKGTGAGMMASTGGMVKRTNDAVFSWLEMGGKARIIGWMADDTIFRQADWAERVISHFDDGCLILTVNDGHLDRERPQSAVFIRTDAVTALGYLALYTQNHLYIDNAWADLRDAVGEFGHHDSDILAEHMHPYVNKGTWDDQYLDIHKKEKYDVDKPAYEKWKDMSFPTDIRRILSCVTS